MGSVVLRERGRRSRAGAEYVKICPSFCQPAPPTLIMTATPPPCILIPLERRTLIRVSGADAQTFLQGQLTQDLQRLQAQQLQWAAQCSPKGRMLASFLMWSQDAAFWLDTGESLSAAVLGRLRPYVLRSRVHLEEARNTRQRLGLVGAADPLLAAAGLPPAPPPGHWDEVQGVTRLALSPQRLMLVAAPPPAADPVAWARLQDALSAQGSWGHPALWDGAGVQEGVAEITLQTQEEWVPQMLNWDLIGGISFHKGCYTGQEIVARSHYLGKIKRRALRFASTRDCAPGDPVYRCDAPTEAVGKVAWVGKTPAGGIELLAVLPWEELADRALTLAPEASPLVALPLPYAIPG